MVVQVIEVEPPGLVRVDSPLGQPIRCLHLRIVLDFFPNQGFVREIFVKSHSMFLVCERSSLVLISLLPRMCLLDIDFVDAIHAGSRAGIDAQPVFPPAGTGFV
jgi:hypothetical protein